MTDDLSDTDIQRLYKNATAALKQNQADQAVANLLHVIIGKISTDTVKFNRILNQVNDAMQQSERRFADLENSAMARHESGLESADTLIAIETRLDSIGARIGTMNGKRQVRKEGLRQVGFDEEEAESALRMLDRMKEMENEKK